MKLYSPKPLVLRSCLTATDHGLPLLKLLTRRFTYHDEARWRTLIQLGLVSLNGRTAAGDCLVSTGDELTCLIEDFPEPQVPTHFEQVMETSDLLLIGKAAGTPVTRTGLIVRQTLVNILRRHYQEEIHPLHRLDRETSGMILCARSKAACRRYQNTKEPLWLGKYYLALVRGCLAVRQLTVDQPLAPREESPVRCRMWVQAHGKPCRTLFNTVATCADYSLILAELRSGRRHQIRAHLDHLGHPLIGDKIYSHDSRYYLKRMDRELSAADYHSLGAHHHTLHAWALRLQLPEGHSALYFSNLFSTDFQSYLHRFPNWEKKARRLLGESRGSDIYPQPDEKGLEPITG